MRRLSHALLGLYAEAQRMPVVDFREHALTWLKSLVPFDSAVVGTLFFDEVARPDCKSPGPGSLHRAPEPPSLRYRAFHLHRQPIEKITEYPAIAPLDTAAAALAASPFKAVRYCVSADPLFGRPAFQPVADYGKRFGIAQSLGYLARRGSTGDGIVLWRGSHRRSFDESSGRIAGCVAPHIFQAADLNLVHFVGSTDSGAVSAGVLVTSRQGVLSAFDAQAFDLLRAEWPQWQPPLLPPALVAAFASTTVARHCGARFTATWVVDGAAVVVRLRAVDPDRRLTPAEWRVAEALADGGSYKEVARALGLSDATVRNHLHAVYGKLALKNKAELMRRMADEQPPA